MKKIFSRSGQILPLAAASIVAMIGFAGLQIDLSTASSRQARLKAITDAAALTGLRTAINDVAASGSSVSMTNAQDRAKELAAYNISQMGLSANALSTIQGQVTAAGSVDGTTKTVKMNVKVSALDSATWLIKVFGSAFQKVVIGAESEAVRYPAAVALVIERTNAVGSAMGDVKTAAKAALDRLADNIDRISLTNYNTKATLDVPMGLLTSSLRSTVVSKIDAMTALGPAAITSDAIAISRKDMISYVNANKSANVGAVKTMIVFAASPPLALKGEFVTKVYDAAKPTFWVTENTPANRYLYSIYADKNSGNNNSFTNTDHVYLPDSVVTASNPVPTSAAPCDYDGYNVYGYTTYGGFDLCICHWQWYDSEGALQGDNSDYTVFPSNAYKVPRQDMYLQAGIEADRARDYRNTSDSADPGVALYAIVLGAPSDSSSSDPFQDISGDQLGQRGKVKSYFFKWLVNAESAATDPKFVAGVSNYQSTDPAGTYWETTTATDLKGLFMAAMDRQWVIRRTK